MSKAIPLGKKLSDLLSVRKMSPDEPDYPEVRIESDDKALAEMPDKGVATIKYRVVSRTHREEKNGNGKEYSCTLHLEILSIEPSAPKKNGNGAKDSDGGARKAFDTYFKDK